MDKAKSWKREIDFQCRFGIWPFQKTLNISARGFEWCGELIPLKEITRLRWGIELIRGGVFPKRTFVAVFGTDAREYVIKTKQKDFYEHLVERYWKAVGRGLLNGMLAGLGEGKTYRFGSAEVRDEGVTVKEQSVFGASAKFYEWAGLRWGVNNGCLSLVSAEKPDKPLVALSFLRDDNTHILGAVLKLFEQSGGKTRLSKVSGSF